MLACVGVEFFELKIRIGTYLSSRKHFLRKTILACSSGTKKGTIYERAGTAQFWFEAEAIK